jgi:hypothetical protein
MSCGWVTSRKRDFSPPKRPDMLWNQPSLLCSKCQGSFLLGTSNADVNNKCNCTSAVPVVCLIGVLLLCLVGLLHYWLVNCRNNEAYERD